MLHALVFVMNERPRSVTPVCMLIILQELGLFVVEAMVIDQPR